MTKNRRIIPSAAPEPASPLTEAPRRKRKNWRSWLTIQVESERYQPPRSGILLLQVLVGIFFFVFVTRFWYLQLHLGSEMTSQAQKNRLRTERIFAPRGRIFDDHGKILADNRTAYGLAIIREDCPDIPATLAQISQWTDMPLEQLQNRYHQDRFKAQMIWLRSGMLQYRFSLGEVDPRQVDWIEFSMEVSSNAPMYREDYKSDIEVAVNGRSLGTWISPGDYGGRRGRFNPPWWSDTASQFGLLKTWRVDATGSRLDGEMISGVCLADLALEEREYIALSIGVREDAAHVGGLNLFGERFGDYPQGIVMRVGYNTDPGLKDPGARESQRSG